MPVQGLVPSLWWSALYVVTVLRANAVWATSFYRGVMCPRVHSVARYLTCVQSMARRRVVTVVKCK